jgi:hypothetical protein
MTVSFFMHTKLKRAEALALVDSGATKNFMNLDYARYLCLPIQRLALPRKLYNVDSTSNQSGDLLYYTDLSVQTGDKRVNLRFFLSNLGENKAILGYPWFMAMQPKIDWRRGWIDHSQLPIIFHTPVTIRNHAYQKLFSFVVTCPSSLLPLPPTRIYDRHVIKLHNT